MLDKIAKLIEVVNGIKSHVIAVLLMILGGRLASSSHTNAHATGASLLLAAAGLLKLPE